MSVKSYTLHKAKTNINYQLFLPQEYETEKNKEYPLILFLHGIKKRGEDISQLNDYGLTWIAENNKNFPFIVVTPQCPSLSDWTLETDSLISLVDEIIFNYRVDKEKLYLTGFSMGGNGAWDLASKYPELFSAMVPISGWFEPEKANLLKNVPIWAFHGEEDDVVSIQGSEIMVKALSSIGGNVKFTSYPALKHNVMSETYNDMELYVWLLKQRKKIV